MELLLIQADIVWRDRDANLKRIQSLLEKVEYQKEGGIIVLPEMFDTGFDTDPLEEIVAGAEIAVEWMKEMACRTGYAMASSVACFDEGRLLNRFFFVRPDGMVEIYDKRHLFRNGGENRLFSRGERRVVVHYLGWRILLQICYDVRFPVFARNAGDYDMAIYVASWPVGRITVWDALLRARAIENQCYVVGVNRVGEDPYEVYNGHSAVYDYYGLALEGNVDGFAGRGLAGTEAVSEDLPGGCRGVAAETQSRIIRVKPSQEKLREFRESFPALEDRDGFVLI